ncbi:MAG: hypothetical protein EBX09_06800 [Actinobacteria bacterium]|nr:hypothetical protein [Actinomycetota bacterium]
MASKVAATSPPAEVPSEGSLVVGDEASGDVGSGHVFRANETEGSSLNIAVGESCVGLAEPWRAEQNESVNACVEALLDCLPALGECGGG